MAKRDPETPRRRQWQTRGGLAREDSDDELGDQDVPWTWIMEEQIEKTESDKTPTRKRKARALSEAEPRIIGARLGSFTCYAGDVVLLKSPEHGKDWAGIISHFSYLNDEHEAEKSANIMWFCSPEELSRGKKSRLRSDLLPNEAFITADFNLNPLESISGKATVLSKDAFFKKYPGGKPPRAKSAAARYAKTILCRQGIKQRTVKYTDEFVWEQKYQGIQDLFDFVEWITDQTKARGKARQPADAMADAAYVQSTKGQAKAPETPRKRRKTTSATSTPKSSTHSSKLMTPTNKRIVVKKPLDITPLGTRIFSPSKLLSSPYQHARTNLHVAAVPASLPGREKEFFTVYKYLHDAITDGTGACIYIAGTPGTGKTATVRDVVTNLNNAVLADELEDFNFVEINGMKVTDPQQSYSLLWEALKGDRVSSTHALDLLEHEFSHPSPRRIPCVVLMDELDQLVTKNQSVMYNFFNWPQSRHSRLIVLAVANTMDLPERTLSNKISSRLGLTTITFPGYDHKQLMSIITSRLEGVPGNIIDPDAVQFAARKVAVVTGDARRALDICRRAVEIAEQEQEQQQEDACAANKMSFNHHHDGTEEDGDTDDDNEGNVDMTVMPETPTKTGRDRRPTSKALHLTHARNRNSNSNPKTVSKSLSKEAKDLEPKLSRTTAARVTITTIKKAIQEAISSPLAQHLRTLPLSSKLFLAALLTRTRRTGIPDTTLGDILLEAKRIADVAENSCARDFLMVDKRLANDSSNSISLPTSKKKDFSHTPKKTTTATITKTTTKSRSRPLSMTASASSLLSSGIIAMETNNNINNNRINKLLFPGPGGGGGNRGHRRADKVKLRVAEEEVKGALMGDEGFRSLGVRD